MRPLISRRIGPQRDHRASIRLRERAVRVAHVAEHGAIFDAARARDALVAELDIDALALKRFEHGGSPRALTEDVRRCRLQKMAQAVPAAGPPLRPAAPSNQHPLTTDEM